MKLVAKIHENAYDKIRSLACVNGLFKACITLPLQSRVNVLDVEIQTWFEYVLRNARGVV